MVGRDYKQASGASLSQAWIPSSSCDAELMAFALHPINQPIEGQDTWNRLLESGYTLLLQKLATMSPPVAKTTAPIDNRVFRFVGLPSTYETDTASNSAVNELDYLKSSKSMTFLDANEWWNSNQSKFPLLAQLARRYLCFPASQTASERDFSQMRLICTHLRNSLSPETAFKLSVVGHVIRRSLNDSQQKHSSSSSPSSHSLDRRVSLRKTRTERLKDRYKNIPPNLQFFPLSKGNDVDDEDFCQYVADNGERESDDDYEYASEEDMSVEDDSPGLYEPPPAKRAMQIVEPSESTYHTRSLQSKSIIKQLDTGLHLYSATFCGLTKAPPSPEKLFGPLYRYIADWRLASGSNPNFFYFGATDSAKQKWTSGKQFLREVGEVKAILPDMY